MTLILIIGLSLVATSGVLVLRSFSLAHAERRAVARPDRRLRLPLHGTVGGEVAEPAARSSSSRTATGERALARFEGFQAAEKGLRDLLNSAGMYQTSVASLIGTRILAAATGPALLFLLALSGGLDLRLLAGGG